MAKTSGLSSALFVGGIDLSGDIGSVSSIAATTNMLDVTAIDKLAYERVPGLRDGTIAFNSWFNPTLSTGEHPNLSVRATTDVGVMVCIPLLALGDSAASMVAKQVDYNPTRQQDGSLALAVNMVSNGFGIEWGQLLTAGKRSDSSGTNPTSGLDDLGGSPTSTAFGATMHVQVFSFTGSNITFTLRDAATEPTYAAVTGGASSAMTAVGTQRWATSSTQTIRRFLSVGTSGTFSQCTFAVSVSRHLSLAL